MWKDGYVIQNRTNEAEQDDDLFSLMYSCGDDCSDNNGNDNDSDNIVG